MRRMVKEDLLTFEGTPLFPERIAQTVPYELTDLEQELYEEVTAYVRDGMNRAERLLDGKRKNTVGFALTVLQRRLASSPEAIYKSLLRRSARLESRRKQILDGTFHDTLTEIDIDDVDGDDYNAEQLEQAEEELLDAATAAQTIAELEAELLHLSDLAALAKRVRDLGTDRKWTELSTILQEHAIPTMRDGQPRKMIIFTEHRDTLDYLRARISSLLGNPYAVSAIHGGVRRHDRRQITEEFTHNAQCQILLATDAAGEGLNLQAAHLMVNYDLPWNPNRIEQRFGRIHRIGQEEVCRLWNLVAINTREGAVFDRLLEKLEQMRLTYGGKVFDVLGEAFTDTPLRDLLKDAVQYGELPETRAKMHEVIDASIGQGLKELLDERALASEHLSDAQLATLRAAMDEARAMRLQPHYIEMAFKAALARLGGRMAKREKGRYEIANVPAAIRASKFSPIATRYERVTFDLEYVRGDGLATADVLAPGHPLHDAVMFETKRLLEGSLRRGTVLISPAVETPQLLVGVVEEVVDGTSDSVARRFGYAFVDEHGTVSPAGPAPYLDCVAAPEGRVTDHARRMPWLAAAEQQAVSWIVTTQLPEYLNQIRPRREAELRRLRELVQSRLESERDRLTFEAMKASEKERLGDRPRESSESLKRKAAELQARLGRRVERIDKQSQMTTKPPSVATAALVLPLSMVEGELPAAAPMHAKETSEVERRGVELVLARERELGRRPIEQSRNNKGFDILSTNASGETFRIEVKARIEGADDFFITHNEVLTAKNAQPRYRLALVRVDPRGAEHDDVRYVADPFATTELGDFDATGIRGDWARTWAKGSVPF
jgi:superfamily II DNA/RNA helicase